MAKSLKLDLLVVWLDLANAFSPAQNVVAGFKNIQGAL
jgi:hypothetical protein